MHNNLKEKKNQKKRRKKFDIQAAGTVCNKIEKVMNNIKQGEKVRKRVQKGHRPCLGKVERSLTPSSEVKGHGSTPNANLIIYSTISKTLLRHNGNNLYNELRYF